MKNYTISRRSLFRLVLLLLAMPLFSQAASVTWSTGASSIAWSSGSNWMGGVAPTTGDDVVIFGGGTFAPSNNAGYSAIVLNSLTLTSNLTSGSDYSVTLGAIDIGAGGITNNMTTAGTFLILSGTVNLAADQTWNGTRSIQVTAPITGSALTGNVNLIINSSNPTWSSGVNITNALSFQTGTYGATWYGVGTGPLTLTNRNSVTLAATSPAFTLDGVANNNSIGSAETIANNITLNDLSGSSNFAISQYSSSAAIPGGHYYLLTGDLTGGSAGRTLTFSNGMASGSGAALYILTGNNSYATQTSVGTYTTLQIGNGGTAGNIGTGAIANSGTLAFNRTDTVTVAPNISGTGTLAFQGSGMTILTGSNTYTGPTLISAGALQIGNGGTSGLLGSGTVTDSGSLIFNRSDTFTVASAITGAGDIQVLGSGTTILTGTSPGYTGTATVSAGTLRLGGNGSALGTGVLIDNSTLNIALSTSGTVANNITGTALVCSGSSATLTTLTGSNSFAGGVTVTSGTLQIGNQYALGTGTLTNNSPNLLFNLPTSGTLANEIDINGGGSNIFITNASTSSTVTLSGAVTGTGVGSYIAFQGTGASNNGFILTGSDNFNLSRLNVKNTNLTIGASNALNNVLGGRITLGDLGGTYSSVYLLNGVNLALAVKDASLTSSTNSMAFTVGINTTGSCTYSGGVDLHVNSTNYANDWTFEADTGGTANFTGAIVNTGTNYNANITKTGSGTVIFSASNSFLGATTISAGTLQLGNGGTVGSISGSASVTDNGTLVFNRTNTVTQGTDFGPLISGSGNLIQAGTGKLILNGTNTYTGFTTISSGTLQVGNGTDAGSIGTTSAVTNNGALVYNTGTGTRTLGAAMSGAGSLTLSSTGGGLTLTGLNSYSGPTSVTGGYLNIQNGSAIGTGTVTVASGAALQLQSGSGITVSNVLNLSGSGISNDGVLRSISGTNTYSGPVSLTGATRINADAGTLYLTSGSIALENNTLIVGGAGNTTFGSILSGNGGLTKDGAGTMTLTNANSFTGGILLSYGILSIGDGTAGHDGSIASASGINLANSSALLYNLSSTASRTYSNVITGPGSLTLSGAGSLTLAGINTFTGNTLVTGGVLTLGNALALQYSVLDTASAAGSITLSGNTATFGGLTGSGALGSVINSFASMITLTLNNQAGINPIYSGSIADGAPGMALVKTGSGTQTLSGSNSFTGGVTVSSGTLQIGNQYALGTGTLTNNTPNLLFNLATSGTVVNGIHINGSNNDIYVTNSSTTSAVTLSGAVSGSATATYFVFQGTGASNAGFVLTGSDGFGLLRLEVKDTNLTIGASNVVNNIVSNRICLGDVGGTSSSIFLLNGVNLSPIVKDAGFTFTTGSIAFTVGINSTGSCTYSGGVDLHNNSLSFSNDWNFEADTGGTANFTGAIVNTGTNYNANITKTGSGTVIFSAANIYTGATTISLGTLQLGNGGTVGSISGSSTITDNGALAFNRSNIVTQGTDFNSVISGSGNVVQAGSGLLILNGANTYTGATTISSGTLQIGNGGTVGSISASSSITDNGTLAFNRSNIVTQGTDFNSVISGSGNVVQAGSGLLILNGTNSYTGATTISSGSLQIGNGTDAGSIASTSAISNNGSLIYNVGTGTRTLGAAISGAGSLTQNSAGGLLTLTGSNTYTGATTISTGTLQIGNGGTTGLLGAGTVTDSGALIFDRSDTVTFANAITGEGSMQILGSGTTILTGTSPSYTGTMTVSAGTLQLGGNGSSLGIGVLVDSGTLNLNLATSGTVANSITGACSLNVLSTSAATTLAGNNSFSGGVSAFNTNLIVGGTSALGSGTLTVTNSAVATLGFNLPTNGTVSNAIMMSSTAGALSISNSSTAATVTLSGAITGSGGNYFTFVGTGATNAGFILTGSNFFNTTRLVIKNTNVTLGNNNAANSPSFPRVSLGDSGGTASSLFLLNGITLSEMVTDAYNTATTNGMAFTVGMNTTGTCTYAGTGGLSADLHHISTSFNNDWNFVADAGATAIFSGQIVNTGTNYNAGITKTGAGTVILSGSNTYAGFTTISTGTLQLGNGGTAGSLSGSSVITDNGTLAFKRSNIVTQGTDFNSVISGSGNVVQAGTGKLILNGTNTYTGTTTIASGTLSMVSAGSIVSSAQIVVGGGVLDVSGLSSTFTTGSTTAQTVLVNSTLTGNVNVGSFGTLVGNGGAVNGTVAVANGGTIGGGGSGWTLHTGALNLNAGSILALTLNGAAGSQIISTAAISLGGSASDRIALSITLTSLPSDNTVYTILHGTSIASTGLFTYGGTDLTNGWEFTVNSGGYTKDFTISYGATDITVTAVPEPGSLVLLLGGLGLLALNRGRRRNFR